MDKPRCIARTLDGRPCPFAAERRWASKPVKYYPACTMHGSGRVNVLSGEWGAGLRSPRRGDDPARFGLTVPDVRRIETEFMQDLEQIRRQANEAAQRRALGVVGEPEVLDLEWECNRRELARAAAGRWAVPETALHSNLP